MSNAVCVCTTSGPDNKLNDVWHKNFNQDNYNSFVITDVSCDSTIKDGFLFKESDLRRNLNFPYNVSNRHYWNSYGNRNITWFYAYLRMLNFYISYPNYNYYWFFDDDVKIDNWEDFLINVDKDTSDFLSYFVFKKIGVKSQPNIPTIDDRTTSKHMWFERFPGDTDNLPKGVNEHFGSFFPTTRYSNKAMKKLLETNFDGYFGYGEGFVPTILNYFGMNLNTLIKSNNTSSLFNNFSNKVYHKNIIIDWEWI